MDEKEKFIKKMLKGEKPFRKICEDFGIREKTGHKRKKRFFEHGLSGLTELSRKTKSSCEIDGDTVAKLMMIGNHRS